MTMRRDSVEWRERTAKERREAGRAARQPALDNDPAVKLYRKEKQRAIRRGSYVLTTTRPPVRLSLTDAAERRRLKDREYAKAHAERRKLTERAAAHLSGERPHG